MSKRDARLFLLDMLESIEKIESYTEGFDFARFAQNKHTVDAVVRWLSFAPMPVKS